MPRRTSTRTLTSTSSTPHATSPALPPAGLSLSSNVVQLRQQWKWAAFSQFFFTFEPLLAMNDVTLMDIEDDLTCSTNIFIPRLMQRLLYTLTQDRKISLDNWQTALRKQYLKRYPEANPFGPEPSSRFSAPRRMSSHPSPDPQTEEVRTCEVSRSTSPTSATLPVGENGGDEGRDRPSSKLREHDIQHPIDNILEKDNKDYKDWLDLPMLVKLDSMHILVEWQFQNPLRLRTIMKDDDEGAEWRIEPLGYDAKGNAYWLIGADRLWIQRVPPKPSNLKRKRSTVGTVSNGKAKVQIKSKGRATKRQRLQPEPLTQISGLTRNTVQTPAQMGTSNRGGRAAKLQANMKLDAQAKELAEFQRQAVCTSPTRTGMKPRTQRPVGTRLSARLRADVADEEWQPVPEEWLMEEGGTTGKSSVGKGAAQSSGVGARLLSKTGLGSDEESISDLTELSEDQDEKSVAAKPDYFEDTQALTAQEKLVDDNGLEEPPFLPEGFIEWETICVTLHEWDHIAERFEKATHYAEKSLHKILVHTIVPAVTADLREVDRKRRLEEAIVHRKRSSRIAIKESEKEEARTAARKRTEAAEKMSRARRLEVRLQKEEADRERREAIREQRRKEREAKELLQRQESSEGNDVDIDVVGNGHQDGDHSQGKIQLNGIMKGPGSGSRTPAGDDWELDCEICQRRGINQDDGTPMMSCGVCSKWQHINCHDQADTRAGHRKRNWDVDEFICRQCRSSNTVGAYQHHRMDQNNSHPAAHPSRSATSRAPCIPPRVDSAPPKSLDDHIGVRNYPAAINGGHYGQSGTPASLNRTIPSQPHQPHTTIAFTHYQPDQHGFSASQTRQPHETYSYPPPPSSHSTQHPDSPAGSHLPAFHHHAHGSSVPHIPATSRMGWNAPPSSQTRSFVSYNGVPDTYLQEREEQQQWQPPNQPPQFPTFPYHQTASALFHVPFQTPQ